MYGTEALTPLAAVPLVKVPVIDVEPQFKAPSVAGMAEASLMQRIEYAYPRGNTPITPVLLVKSKTLESLTFIVLE